MEQGPVLSYATPVRRAAPRFHWRSAVIFTTTILFFGALITTILLPGINGEPVRSDRLECSSHLRQIGQGILLYQNDHGRQPSNLGDLVLEDLSAEVMICPASGDSKAQGTQKQQAAAVAKPGNNCSFIYIGASLTPQSPPNAIAAYEKLSNHGDGVNVLYNDGRVDWLSKLQAQWVISELQSGHNPPRARP